MSLADYFCASEFKNHGIADGDGLTYSFKRTLTLHQVDCPTVGDGILTSADLRGSGVLARLAENGVGLVPGLDAQNEWEPVWMVCDKCGTDTVPVEEWRGYARTLLKERGYRT